MERNSMMHVVAQAQCDRPGHDFHSQQAETSAFKVLAKLVRMLTSGVGSRGVGPKRMQIVETLAVGPKTKLLLVSCGGEHFLVGTGPESVQTIVPTRSERRSTISRPVTMEDEA
jgi:hypothetical protein